MMATPPSSPSDSEAVMDSLKVPDLADSVVEEAEPEGYDRDAAVAARKEAVLNGATRRRRSVPWRYRSERVFGDLYQLKDEVLGRGAHATVQTCVDRHTSEECAVKIIHKTADSERVFNEIDLFYRVQGHPNIIKLIMHYEEDDQWLLIFEKVSGGPLLDHFQRGTVFTEEEAAGIVADVASALKFLHSKGVAHRDVKPENLLCVHSNLPTTVKLCDFDLASRGSGGDKDPLFTDAAGTFDFMAPEIVPAYADMEEVEYDKRCDLWSLGVLAHLLLYNQVPFTGRCEAACGWDEGGNCQACGLDLLRNIQAGRRQAVPAGRRPSSEAADLVQQLLQHDPARRLGAAAVLEHPWLGGRAGTGDSETSPDSSLASSGSSAT